VGVEAFAKSSFREWINGENPLFKSGKTEAAETGGEKRFTAKSHSR
jgi:hypothetical protein